MINKKESDKAMMDYLNGKRLYHLCNYKSMQNSISTISTDSFMQRLEKELEKISKYDGMIVTLNSLNYVPEASPQTAPGHHQVKTHGDHLDNRGLLSE